MAFTFRAPYLSCPSERLSSSSRVLVSPWTGTVFIVDTTLPLEKEMSLNQEVGGIGRLSALQSSCRTPFSFLSLTVMCL